MGVHLIFSWWALTFIILIFIMKSLLPLCFLVAIFIEFSEAGLAFKAGLVKGALKGLLKGSSGAKEDEQCETRWEEVWKPVCSQHYETKCRNEPQQQCQTEQRQECWTENRRQCSTTQETVCNTEYQQQCSTEYEEECWSEAEQECTQQTECFDPPPPSTHTTYSSSSSSKKFKRSVDEDDEDLEISDEELKATLDSMSASDLLELSEELDNQESLAESDEEAGRSKRGLLGLLALKKHLKLKKVNKKFPGLIPAAIIAPTVVASKAPLAVAP